VLDPGVLIDERHEIEHLLGRGGMAEVFRARDTTTGRSVAIKVLRTVDPQSTIRFRGEIEVLSRLDHPGLVRLVGAGAHDGVPYLVLDLVDGPSLADVLNSGPLGVERSISIGGQLADALAHAHGLGVVHRDLKPANIIFDTEPTTVRLADFGIARFADTTRITSAGQCIGTAAYLAPEQLEGEVGPAADIYALGLVVLECLTGTRCYPGTAAETTMARLHHPPDVPADLPAWLRHTLRAMTARDPRGRPPAHAVGDAFCCRSVDPVVVSTTEIDAAVQSDTAPPGDQAALDTTDTGTTTATSRDARSGRRHLLVAFGCGALTSAAALIAGALFLMVGPIGGNGAQATESRTPPAPTEIPTSSLPIQTHDSLPPAPPSSMGCTTRSKTNNPPTPQLQTGTTRSTTARAEITVTARAPGIRGSTTAPVGLVISNSRQSHRSAGRREPFVLPADPATGAIANLRSGREGSCDHE
jgi:serine/threonine protein kinase